jgi:hypothetical protein
MPCAHPITIDTSAGPVDVRCKQCLQCRIMKQSALSLRCILEHQLSWSSYFLTLTYADAPEKGDWKDFSKFMKRLRIWNTRKQKNTEPIRFLGCGEYGSKNGRFHYHALIWNTAQLSEETLGKLWPHGFVYIGSVTPGSIRYTARYTLKFHTKGEEAIANWSKRPPLGADGMRQIAQYMKTNGYKVQKVEPAMRIEDKTYWLDDTMKNIFRLEYGIEQEHIPNVMRHMNYCAVRKFGDPLERERKRLEDRATFWQTARFTNDTF